MPIWRSIGQQTKSLQNPDLLLKKIFKIENLSRDIAATERVIHRKYPDINL